MELIEIMKSQYPLLREDNEETVKKILKLYMRFLEIYGYGLKSNISATES